MGKKGGKRGKAAAGPQAPPVVTENNKEFYVVQIHDLEQRVSTYQKKCDELEIANAEYQVRLDRIRDDQNDIVSFIEKKLEKKREEIKEISANIQLLQIAKLDEQKLFHEQMKVLTDEYNEVKENLTKENEQLSNKIESLEDFKENKDSLFTQIKDLETDLFDQEAEHRDARYILDKQHLIEKDKLKQEMLQQVMVVANEYKRISQMQMSETTKRTIRENVAIHDQLMKMSEKTTELIDENEDLKMKISKQKREIKILEENAKMLIKKNVCNHQTLTLLKAKCQTLGDTLTRGVIETKDRLEELVAESKNLSYELKQGKNSLKEILSKNQAFEKEKERLFGEVEEKETLKLELQKLITSSAVAVEKLIRPGPIESCEGIPTITPLKREQLLGDLLIILNYSQGFSFHVSSDSRLAGSSSFNALVLENKRMLENIPQYKPGYLGLIPYRDIFPKSSKGKMSYDLVKRSTKSTSCHFKSRSLISKPKEFDKKTIALAEGLKENSKNILTPKISCKLPSIASEKLHGVC